MSQTSKWEVNAADSDNETNSMEGNAASDVNSEKCPQKSLVLSRQVAGQMEEVAEALTRQLELVCDLLIDSKEDLKKPTEETITPDQGSLQAFGSTSDTSTLSYPKIYLKVAAEKLSIFLWSPDSIDSINGSCNMTYIPRLFVGFGF